MRDCKEFALEDLTAITVIPLAKYVPSADTMLSTTISADDFNPTIDADAVIIGSVIPYDTQAAVVPIIHSTGKVKDTSADSVAGRLHTVSVECDVDARDSDVWPVLHAIERQAAHLLLTSRDGTRFFVEGSQDTYLCRVERDGAKTSVSFAVQCLMGLQILII